MSKLDILALGCIQAGADVEIELVIHYQMLATKRKTEAVKVAVLPEVQHPFHPGLHMPASLLTLSHLHQPLLQASLCNMCVTAMEELLYSNKFVLNFMDANPDSMFAAAPWSSACQAALVQPPQQESNL